ncbi:MAG: alpha/beta hydrolase fold protein [Solirubrobacterales bacterium]|jgi:pimeloyl-ACP methyl ester carboxylesterase|nr:alpha/beta hydrolase fold protein [Solirubrobacterales bacterium]
MPTRNDVTFPSGGERCAAYLYQPAGGLDPADPVPCVVMAHGFSATRDDGLPAYATAFAEAGFAVLVFDYRHFGSSSGEPRQLLDIGRQQDDYRAAIAHVRTLPGVDPDQVALWGSSFSGGHVLTVAASDPRIAAVLAQAPYVDSIPVLAGTPPRNILRGTAEGLFDLVGSLLGRPPHCIPAVAEPGGFAVMTQPQAVPGFAAIAPHGSRWENRVAARIMLGLAPYRPCRHAAGLRMPLLVSVCDQDQVTPPEPAARVAERAPRGELLRYPYGHFDIYSDPQPRADQVAFLVRHLRTARTRAAQQR